MHCSHNCVHRFRFNNLIRGLVPDLPEHRKGLAPAVFLFMSNQLSQGSIMLYQIIVRNGSANHYASSDNQTCAHTIFNALTKTFRHVELWQGATLIQQYKNC